MRSEFLRSHIGAGEKGEGAQASEKTFGETHTCRKIRGKVVVVCVTEVSEATIRSLFPRKSSRILLHWIQTIKIILRKPVRYYVYSVVLSLLPFSREN